VTAMSAAAMNKERDRKKLLTLLSIGLVVLFSLAGLVYKVVHFG
jgi:hypothetical protein